MMPMLYKKNFKYIISLGIFLIILISNAKYTKAIEVENIGNIENTIHQIDTSNQTNNISLSRADQLSELKTEVHNKNIELKNKETLTKEALLEKMMDEQTAKMLIDIEQTIMITKIRYATSTETFISLLERINTNIDERENFGFNVNVEIATLENIKKELINNYILSEQLAFNLSNKDDFNLSDINAELERNKNISKVLLTKQIKIKKDILQLIQLIQDAK